VARVLILDPDPEARTLLELYFARLGHGAVGPRDIADGTSEPDLVVVDPAAPAALAQAEQLRRRFRRLPIVCVSANPPTPEAETLDPVAYLSKPARSLVLDWAVAEALERAEPGLAAAV
jgi:CheY-like chemotaxis protein